MRRLIYHCRPGFIYMISSNRVKWSLIKLLTQYDHNSRMLLMDALTNMYHTKLLLNPGFTISKKALKLENTCMI